MKVRAVVSVEHDRPLVIDELEVGDPGPTHVVVKQFATGVCHSQLLQIHRAESVRPMVLGHESTGVVVARGREVSHVREGDRVLLTWVRRAVAPGQPEPRPWPVT
ncbi:MAG TPA: alcohol dehydrogenase catalytic domain-containing protein, partial [Vicinamibacteria bacterium]|nr:alcohol dehydrogenase catalytic domain-containing protein [Vicinamibacteria bacterium]